MTPQFSASRSAAIRQELVAAVETNTRKPLASNVRRWIPTLGVLAAGMLVGGAVSAAALTMGSPNPGADAVPGLLPGQPVVTELGQVATLVVSESTSLPLLNVPENATHLRVTVTCLSEGLTKWGFDPEGNNPGMGCSEDDIGEYGAWYDFALTASAALYIDVSPGAESRISYQYLHLTETAWGVNDAGETYGVPKQGLGNADLVVAVGKDADGNEVSGYLRTSDLNAFGPDWPDQPSSPEEAIRWQEERDRLYPNGWDIPLYESDGRTQIGTSHVGG
jgi:hypothetical protein